MLSLTRIRPMVVPFLTGTRPISLAGGGTTELIIDGLCTASISAPLESVSGSEWA